MPYTKDSNRHPHLEMRVAAPTVAARKNINRNPQKPPERGPRDQFAQGIVRRVGQLLTQTRARVLAAGVDPALVVRFGLAKGANLVELASRLSEAGLEVVAVEPDKQAIVAFRADDDLRDFLQAMRAFEVGPAAGKKTSKWDVLAFIDPTDVRPWSRADRIGPRLREAVEQVQFAPDQLYKLDVELWHAGSVEAAQAAVAKLRRFIESRRDRGARILDQFVGRTLCLLRVALRGKEVDELLEIPEVAEVDLPPRCTFDALPAAAGLATPFPIPAPPPADGPRVCILDSGITSGHPLLGPFVGDATSFHSSITSAADNHGHGTAVAGVAVFGDIRQHVVAGHFQSTITLFSARMLNDANELDEDRLVVNQIREAIAKYAAPPFNCRVFNLSFGERRTFLEKTGGRQGRWAEAIDIVAAELDVVVVVSAGNVPVVTTNPAEAEALFMSKGRHLRGAEHRLVDPATAALAVTVGSIAARSQQSQGVGVAADDIALPLVNAGDPSPFTRVGPGVVGAVKPDFVDDGGNLAWKGTGSTKGIARDDATSVLLLSNRYRAGITGWFRYDVGTSFAAPRASRVAAMIADSLAKQTGRPPGANLIRAILGTGAEHTAADHDERCGKGATVAFTGYGQIDEDYSLWSSDARVVTFSEEELQLDHFAMFELPMPAEFVNIPGRKTLSVALAYDPPVRARRADYLGVGMDFDVFRGVSQDLLFEHVRTRKEDDDGPVPAIEKRYKLKLSPSKGSNQEFGWSRSKSTLQVGRFPFTRSDAKDGWWLVVRARRRWAPNEYEKQRFAVAVVMESALGDLYVRVQARLRARGRARARG